MRHLKARDSPSSTVFLRAVINLQVSAREAAVDAILERDEFQGMQRVKAALEAYIWPGLEMKDPADQQSIDEGADYGNGLLTELNAREALNGHQAEEPLSEGAFPILHFFYPRQVIPRQQQNTTGCQKRQKCGPTAWQCSDVQ